MDNDLIARLRFTQENGLFSAVEGDKYASWGEAADALAAAQAEIAEAQIESGFWKQKAANWEVQCVATKEASDKGLDLYVKAQAEIARQRKVIETWHSEYSKLEGALFRKCQDAGHCDEIECVDTHSGHCHCREDYNAAIRALKDKP